MNNILRNIFPDTLSNNYSGTKTAFITFVIITAFTLIRSIIHIIAPDGGAQSIAGFPLQTYTSDASNLIILLFSLWGLSQLLLGFVMALVAVKYKNMIPLFYLIVLVEYSARLVIGLYKPAESMHVVPGGIGNYLMIPLAGVMFYLSQPTK